LRKTIDALKKQVPNLLKKEIKQSQIPIKQKRAKYIQKYVNNEFPG
jgi:hypothetical protein